MILRRTNCLPFKAYKNKFGLQKRIQDFHIVLLFHVSLLIFLTHSYFFSKFTMGGDTGQSYVYHCSPAQHKHRLQISNQRITPNVAFNFKSSVQMAIEDQCGDKIGTSFLRNLTAHLGHNQAVNLI